jgi:hypothetical protein
MHVSALHFTCPLFLSNLGWLFFALLYFTVSGDKIFLKCIKISNCYRCFTFIYKLLLRLQTNMYVNADIFLQKQLCPGTRGISTN